MPHHVFSFRSMAAARQGTLVSVPMGPGGPQKFMKNRASHGLMRQLRMMVVPTERRGRRGSEEVETECLSDPEHANERMLVNVHLHTEWNST